MYLPFQKRRCFGRGVRKGLTMLVVEPVQAAIWHCLNHYAYQDATFLAERLLDEADTDESIFLAVGGGLI